MHTDRCVFQKRNKNDAINVIVYVDDILITGTENMIKWFKNMMSELKQLTAPGMKDMKKADLYTKWRPLLPKEYRDITCPHPGDDVLKKVRDQRNEAAAVAKATKSNTKKLKTASKKPTNDPFI